MGTSDQAGTFKEVISSFHKITSLQLSLNNSFWHALNELKYNLNILV